MITSFTVRASVFFHRSTWFSTYTPLHPQKVPLFFLTSVPLKPVMKALPKTELSGNLPHCRSITVVVSRVRQDAENFRSIHTRKQSKTKLLESGHEGNVYLLQFRVAFSRTKEKPLIASQAKKRHKDAFCNRVCLTRAVSITRMQNRRLFNTEDSYFLHRRQRQLQHKLLYFSFLSLFLLDQTGPG